MLVKKALLLDPVDNVATLIADAEAGDEITLCNTKDEVTGHIKAEEPIPFAHKIALSAIKEGEPVIKSGVRIGMATAKIGAGEYVHAHNLISIEGMRGVAEKSGNGAKSDTGIGGVK